MKKAIIIIIVLFLAALWMPTQRASGLGQRLAVQYIQAIAADMKLTPEQVKNLTKEQAATYILAYHPNIPTGKLKEASTYWKNIKIMLYNDAVERQTIARLVLFRQRLLAAYPDAVGLDTQYAKDIGRQVLPLLYGEVDPNALD